MATSPNTLPKLFYNVLPKDRASGPLTNITGENSGGAIGLSGGPEGLASKLPSRTIIFAAIALVVLIAGGFTLYSIFKTDAPVEPVPVVEEPTPEPAPEPIPEEQPTGVTTSDAWQAQYFNNAVCANTSICGDDADPDRDGLANLQEFQRESDPNNADSDSDQISDGDEVNVFGLNPLKFRTASDPLYSDTDYIRGGYDSGSGQKYTADQIANIKQKISQFGLHQPTVGALGDAAFLIYGFGDQSSLNTRDGGASNTSGSTSTPEAKLDHDIQRQSTIKKIGGALLKYKAENGSFPGGVDFNDMYAKVKSYNLVATNPKDPINQAPYVYTYEATSNDQDFVLGYLSETQNQVIKYRAQDAQKDTVLESASGNDDRRTTDLETIRSALLIYSSANVAGGREYIFPTTVDYKTALVPKYLTSIPKDPKTDADYQYEPSQTFDSFTLKAVLENPSAGTTGYLCNQEECRNY